MRLVYPGADKGGGDVLFPRRATASNFIAFAQRPPTEEASYDVLLDRGVPGVRVIGTAVEFLDARGAPRLRMAQPTLFDSRCNAFAVRKSVNRERPDRRIVNTEMGPA